MRSLSSTGFAVFGAALVAISYGLARFAFGLFVPQIRDELSLTPDAIGIIGALPLVSFLLSTAVAPYATDRLGARYAAVLSGLFGVGGLALISQAQDATLLSVGVFACGICTGLMMPALTAGMQALVRRSLHARVSSVMNAGTSIGVIVAVPTVLFMADAWRLAYLSFAVLTVIGVCATWLYLPSVSRITPSNAADPPPLHELPWSRLIRLSLFAYAMGFISAAYWIFAPDLVVTLGGLSPSAHGVVVARRRHRRARRCGSRGSGRSQQSAHHPGLDADHAGGKPGLACCQSRPTCVGSILRSCLWACLHELDRPLPDDGYSPAARASGDGAGAAFHGRVTWPGHRLADHRRTAQCLQLR